MIRIAALNDSSDDSARESDDGNLTQANLTKEAVENAAYSLYNKGLGYERAGLADKAIQSLEDLLRSGFIANANGTLTGDGQLRPSALLKYSALKNLAKVYSQRDRHQDAIEALLQAVEIDFTDVSVCYRLGVLAMKLDHLLLASRAFEKGLELSPNHWPCLDNLLTLLYVLNNYESCLCYISAGLERDSGYIKALVLRKAIYKEQPCLESEYAGMFKKCNTDEILGYTKCLDPEDECEVLSQIRQMRKVQSERCKVKAKPTVNLDLPTLSWAALGRRLLDMYTYIEEKFPQLDHSCLLTMNERRGPAQAGRDRPVERAPCSSKKVIGADYTVTGSSVMPRPASPLLSLNPNTDSNTSLYPVSISTSESDQASRDAVAKRHHHSESQDTREYQDSTAARSQSPQVGISNVIDGILNHIVWTEGQKEAPMELSTNDSSVDDVVDDIINNVTKSATAVETVVSAIVNQVADTFEKQQSDVDAMVSGIVNGMIDKVIEREDNDESIILAHQSMSDHMYAKISSSVSGMDRTSSSKDPPVSLALERKRRSARVKVTTGKQGSGETEKEDKKDHISELESIVPSTLQHETTPEHGYHKTDLLSDDNTGTPERPLVSTATSLPDNPFENEAQDVSMFLARFESNMGVVHVMREWIYELCSRRMNTWPADLVDVYIDVYEKHRPCYQRPNIFTSSRVEKDAFPSLLWMELKIDQANVNDNKDILLQREFDHDFTYWRMIVGNQMLLPTACEEFSVRYYYMAAKFYISTYEPGDAVSVYRNLQEYIGSVSVGKSARVSVTVPNAKSISTITLESVNEELRLLERAQSLDKLQSVYDSGEYSKVLELLSVTFDIDIRKRFTDSRHSQLSLLLSTIEKVPDLEDSIKWLSETLHEAVRHSDKSCKGNWVVIICRSLALLTGKVSGNTLSESPSLKVRIAQSCFAIIRVNTSALEMEKEMPVKSLLPWILLSKLTKMEDGDHVLPTDISSPTNELPPYIQLLIRGHTFLAKYRICTASNGSLLQFTMDELIDFMGSAQCGDPQLAERHLRQCIYCLYSYPNKKIKAKNLNDHGSSTIPISWTVAQQLFDFYKPKSVPEFDSYKSSTISAELEHLFRRLTVLVPEQCPPDAGVMGTVDSYLNETTTLADLDNLSTTKQNILCNEGFYLLADYYFKNKEPLKAIKHYMQDLYYKPHRLDSWAGMALAKSSKLESRLGLMERQCYDGAFQKLAVSTMQSFARALQLNHDNVKLWIEYACSAYQLHSFASRAMKTRKSELSPAELSTFAELKREMLAKSKHCYIEASRCKDEEFEEEWLHHYMLGKISEKSNEDPEIHLNHYIKAIECLDAEGAQYPPKISYMYNPPYLAVEALEMYYRVHATILKYVQREETTQHYTLYTQILMSMKKVPFASAQVSSPQVPAAKKKRVANEPADKATRKRTKSETELVAPLPTVTITTRRQEKIRQDAEIVNEVMDLMLSNLDSIEYNGGPALTAQSSSSESYLDMDRDNAVMRDVRIVLDDVITIINNSSQDGLSSGVDNHLRSEDDKGSHGAATYRESSVSEHVAITSGGVLPGKWSKEEEVGTERYTGKRKTPAVGRGDDDIVFRKSPVASSHTYGRSRSPFKRPHAQLERNGGDGDAISIIDITSQSDDDSIRVIDLRSLSDDNLSSYTTEHQSKVVKPDANDWIVAEQCLTDLLDRVEQAVPATSGEADVLSKEVIIDNCIVALRLCIQRFPLHYKSYFRLAKTYLHDKQRRDLDKVQDLLLGNTGKRKDDKFVTQGLFQDRKHNNFFNGVWRIPVEEIERAGSFGAHLYRTIYLLLQFLHEKRDYHLLYQLHTQLNRTPDQERKFLKDADRLLLSSKAMEFAIHSLYKVIGSDTDDRGEYNYAASLHQAYKWYNYCNKNAICVPNAQVLLLKAYKAYRQALDQQTESKVPIADAKEFCQQMFSARSKDKLKSAGNKQVAGLDLTPTRSANSPSRQGKGASSTFPPVRGSLQSLDSEKSKTARVLISSLKADVGSTPEHPPSIESNKVDTQPNIKPISADIPKTSWLNKAKEGTTVLASMFEKPKS